MGFLKDMMIIVSTTTDRLRALRGAPEGGTRSEALAIEIEALILRGEIADGERFPTEPELCDLLGVSRSVVRDSIRMLVARGLLSVRQGDGTVVTAPSDSAFGDALIALLMRADLSTGDVLQAREAIETELAPVAAERGSAADWDAMEGFLDELESAVAAEDWAAARAAHTQFHLAIFRALHLPALELMLAPMQRCILITSLPPDEDSSEIWEVEAHPPILAALRAGDHDGVQAAMRAHFREMGSGDAFRNLREAPFREKAELEAYRSQPRHAEARPG